jgi:uncharacterized membrane protein
MVDIMPAMNSSPAALGPRRDLANGTRAVAVASLIGLVVLSLAWELWLAPTGSGMLALKALPLLIPLAGLLRRRMYTYRWVSLFVWLYFTEGVVRATSDRGPGVWLALIEVLLCLLLFAACAVHVRWRLKHAVVAEEVASAAGSSAAGSSAAGSTAA